MRAKDLAKAVTSAVLTELEKEGPCVSDELEVVAHEAIVECAKRDPVVINGDHVLVVVDTDWPEGDQSRRQLGGVRRIV